MKKTMVNLPGAPSSSCRGRGNPVPAGIAAVISAGLISLFSLSCHLGLWLCWVQVLPPVGVWQWWDRAVSQAAAGCGLWVSLQSQGSTVRRGCSMGMGWGK